ncbi:GFA family protein [Hellea balneolensis]|uniref:GFA family protein n=1 Tax=Hellea balneolensis TaxID=287478 RepID=UPI00047977A0|nr:GFA family protein [Hellea balneolensis]
MTKLNGKCLCGEVAFKVEEPAHLDSCHCGQCRTWSGSVNMSLDFTMVEFENRKGLKWYRSSEWAERGFCSTCGSSLFYRLVEDLSKMSVCVGAVQGISDDVKITKEFFIEEKPGFYNLEGEREKLTGAEVFALYGAE